MNSATKAPRHEGKYLAFFRRKTTLCLVTSWHLFSRATLDPTQHLIQNRFSIEELLFNLDVE